MAAVETSKISKRGALTLPARLRQRFGLHHGSVVIVEERTEGILLRPIATPPIEQYTPERIAEFLLSSAVDAEDYAEAVEEVRRLGLDPAEISHYKPPDA